MYNLAIIIGRTTATPELKTTQNGTSVCSFTVACDRTFRTADGEKVTDFLNCVAWRGHAEFICKHFQKGSPIGLQGNIQNRSYTDKNGNQRTVTEIVVDRAFFVGGKERTQVEVENPAQDEPDSAEDLPF